MAEHQGNLYIYVDKPEERTTEPNTSEAGEVFGLCEPGDPLWYLTGWAVGKNARSQYCSRTSTSKLRKFDSVAEAISFVRTKRKARPGETFYFVYELDGRKYVVNCWEQIQDLDRDLTNPDSPAFQDLAPSYKLEALTERVGRIVATNALILLRTLGKEGEAAARQRFSAATFERLLQALKDVELVA